MAKRRNLSPALLLAISSALLCAGWLMRSFPVLIFAGLAPLFAMTDHAGQEARIWNRAELILIALAIGLFAAHGFRLNFLVISIVEAIALTLVFLGYSFVDQRLGSWLGKIMIVIFWLALEYVFLKLPWRNSVAYLGDALALKTGWLKWTYYTGYLGSSLWILIANLLVYLSLFRGEKVNWVFLGLTLLWITGPIGFSFVREEPPVLKTDMIMRYSDKYSSLNQNYIQLGEVIAVTASGMSGVILLMAVLWNKKRK